MLDRRAGKANRQESKARETEQKPAAGKRTRVEELAADRPLPSELRARLEKTAGRDLGDVRVGIGPDSQAAAESLGARAFAFGSQIHFAAGQYAPTTEDGQHLVAHEVAHTIQQSGSGRGVQLKPAVATSSSRAEREADAFASAFSFGQPGPTLTRHSPAIQLARSGAPVRIPARTTAKASAQDPSKHAVIAADLAFVDTVLIPQVTAAKDALDGPAIEMLGGELARLLRRVVVQVKRLRKSHASELLKRRTKKQLRRALDAVGLHEFQGRRVAGVAVPKADVSKPRAFVSVVFESSKTTARAASAVGRAQALLLLADSQRNKGKESTEPFERRAVAALESLRGHGDAVLFAKIALERSGNRKAIDKTVGGEGRTGAALFEEALDTKRRVPQTVAGVIAKVAEAKIEYQKPNLEATETLLADAERGLRRFANSKRFEQVRRAGGYGFSTQILRQSLDCVGAIGNMRRKVGLGLDGTRGTADWDRSAKMLEVYREPLELLARERPAKEGRTLKAIDKGAVLSLGAITGAALGPALGLKAATVLAAEARLAWTAALPIRNWVLHNAEATQAVAELAVGLGLDIADSGGVKPFLESLKSPDALLTLVIDLVVTKQALGNGVPRYADRGTSTKKGAYRDSVRTKVEADGPESLRTRIASGARLTLDRINALIEAVRAYHAGRKDPKNAPLTKHYESALTERIAKRATHGGDVIEVFASEAAQTIAQLEKDGASVSVKSQTALSGDVVYKVKLKNGQRLTLLSRKQAPKYDRRGVSKADVKRNEARAAESRELNKKRSANATAKVNSLPREKDKAGETHVLHTFPRIIGGGGYSAITDAGTLGNPNRIGAGKSDVDVLDTVAFAAGVEPWSTRPVDLGQPHAEISTTGSKQPRELSRVDQGFLEASALSNALDIARAEAGMLTVYDHRVVGVLEKANAKNAHWAVPSANVRVEVEVGGKMLYYYADKVDLAMGPGESRKLAPAHFGEANTKEGRRRSAVKERKLEADGRLMSGEQAVANPPKGKVLVSGGAATGSWAVEYAESNNITWIGRINKDDGKPVLDRGVATQVKEAKTKVDELLANPKLSANERAYFEAFRDRLLSHGKAILPRNTRQGGSMAKANVEIKSGASIKRVRATEDLKPTDLPPGLKGYAGKKGKVFVEFDGMDADVFDTVVVAHGQDSTRRGGIADVTKDLQLELDRVDKKLAALKSKEGNVRVLGAAMWDGALQDPNRLVGKKKAVRELQTEGTILGDSLPEHSQGILPSLNATAETIGRAND